MLSKSGMDLLLAFVLTSASALIVSSSGEVFLNESSTAGLTSQTTCVLIELLLVGIEVSSSLTSVFHDACVVQSLHSIVTTPSFGGRHFTWHRLKHAKQQHKKIPPTPPMTIACKGTASAGKGARVDVGDVGADVGASVKVTIVKLSWSAAGSVARTSSVVRGTRTSSAADDVTTILCSKVGPSIVEGSSGRPVTSERAFAIFDAIVSDSIAMANVTDALPTSSLEYLIDEATVAAPVWSRRSPFSRLLQPVTVTVAVTTDNAASKVVAIAFLTSSVETPVQGYDANINVSETTNSLTTLTSQVPTHCSFAADSRADVFGASLSFVIAIETTCTSAGAGVGADEGTLVGDAVGECVAPGGKGVGASVGAFVGECVAPCSKGF
jgi:hypothetical protein